MANEDGAVVVPDEVTRVYGEGDTAVFAGAASRSKSIAAS